MVLPLVPLGVANAELVVHELHVAHVDLVGRPDELLFCDFVERATIRDEVRGECPLRCDDNRCHDGRNVLLGETERLWTPSNATPPFDARRDLNAQRGARRRTDRQGRVKTFRVP